MEKSTPTFAQIETIRFYELIPEKAYGWKIITIFLFDLFFLSIILYGYYFSRPFFDESNSNILSIMQQSLYSIFGVGDLPTLILILNIHILVYFVLPILAFMTIRYFLPWVFRNVFQLLNKLNPFNHDRHNHFKSGNLAKFEKRKKKEKRKVRKIHPFLSFKESALGTVTMRYLAFIHWIAHFVFLLSGISSLYFKGREDNFSYKVIIGIYILNLIVFWYLRKEPERSIDVAKNKLKVAFSYYCEPYKRAQLSPLEKKVFDENFEYRITRDVTHRKGYFQYGIYHNQQMTYGVVLIIKDLKTNLSYYLRYRTTDEFERWDGVSGKVTLTNRGAF